MSEELPQKKSNKRSLPKGQNGFTLVELLVVIVILAILGVVGMTLFSSTQSRARDAKRKEDIGAIASAMEANYVPGTGYVTVLSSGWFADGAIPSNPGPGGAAYSLSGATTSTFTICGTLENSTGNAGSLTGTGMGTSTGLYFCKKNAQ